MLKNNLIYIICVCAIIVLVALHPTTLVALVLAEVIKRKTKKMFDIKKMFDGF